MTNNYSDIIKFDIVSRNSDKKGGDYAVYDTEFYNQYLQELSEWISTDMAFCDLRESVKDISEEIKITKKLVINFRKRFKDGEFSSLSDVDKETWRKNSKSYVYYLRKLSVLRYISRHMNLAYSDLRGRSRDIIEKKTRGISSPTARYFDSTYNVDFFTKNLNEYFVSTIKERVSNA